MFLQDLTTHDHESLLQAENLPLQLVEMSLFPTKQTPMENPGSRTRLLIKPLKITKSLYKFVVSVKAYLKISIITQFSFDILQFGYRELLLEDPGVPDHTHTNGLNQAYVFVYA